MIQLQNKKFGRLLETWSMVIKASGLDEICGFKKQQPYSANNLPPFVTKLFHKLYDLNVFSPDWYKYVIIPLFEKVTIQTQTITLSLLIKRGQERWFAGVVFSPFE